MKINQLKMGSLLSYVQMVLTIIISLVYTPLVLKALGQSEYGLYQTVQSSVTMLTMLNLGLNVSYVHFYAKYQQKNDEEGMARFNGLYMTILAILALVCLIAGLMMTWRIEWIFADGLSAAEYQTARILMVLLVVNITISFPISTFTGIISANERFVFFNVLQIVKNLVSHAVSLIVLYAGFRSVGIVCVTVTISILADIVYVWYCFGKLKCKIQFSQFEKGLFKSLLTFTLFIAMNSLIDQINQNVDKLLLARFRGTEAVAVYNIGFLIYTYYQTLSVSISGVLAPRVHKYVYETIQDSEKQRSVLTNLFVKVGRIQFFILSLVCTGFIFFGKSFITCYWANEQYANSYYVALILVISVSIPLIQNVGITILQAQNKHKFRSLLYLGIAVCNLLLSIKLCQMYGEIGSTIGTAMALLIGNGLIINIYYHKRANINIICFWKSILRASVGLIIPIIAGILLSTWIDQSNLIVFISGIVGYSVIYFVSMWFLAMNQEEKQMLTEPLKKLRKRRKRYELR